MNAWEITNEDIETVLTAHGVVLSERHVIDIRGRIDMDAVIQAVLCYAEFDDQCQSALCDIERQLSQFGVIDSDPCFCPPQN